VNESPAETQLAHLALVNESLGVLHTPAAKPHSPQLSRVQDITEEVELEALAPTMGIVYGIRLSLMLWSVIGLIILFMP